MKLSGPFYAIHPSSQETVHQYVLIVTILPSSLPPFLPSSLPPFLPSSLPPFLPSSLPPILPFSHSPILPFLFSLLFSLLFFHFSLLSLLSLSLNLIRGQ